MITHATDEQPQPSADELREQLINTFKANYLDGDDPTTGYMIDADEVIDFIDDFVLPAIHQREAAARLDELTKVFGDIPETWRDSPKGVSMTRGDIYSLRKQLAALTSSTKKEGVEQ